MEIKAAVTFKQSDEFRMDQLELSEPNDDEVLVRVVATGICHTDLAAPGRAFTASAAAECLRA
jgi:aryl-alcohol dehydrogenase